MLLSVAYAPSARKQAIHAAATEVPGGASALVLRPERETPDPAFLDEADAKFRRTVGEVCHVDVVIELRDAAEGDGTQFAELGQYRLIDRQLLARLRGYCRRHLIVVGPAAGERVDVSTQCLLGAGGWR